MAARRMMKSLSQVLSELVKTVGKISMRRKREGNEEEEENALHINAQTQPIGPVCHGKPLVLGKESSELKTSLLEDKWLPLVDKIICASCYFFLTD